MRYPLRGQRDIAARCASGAEVSIAPDCRRGARHLGPLCPELYVGDEGCLPAREAPTHPPAGLRARSRAPAGRPGRGARATVHVEADALAGTLHDAAYEAARAR